MPPHLENFTIYYYISSYQKSFSLFYFTKIFLNDNDPQTGAIRL